MRTSWDISPSSSSAEDFEELPPTQLLSLAIKKRRALYESKDRDFRKELLHTGMIQTLCKFLGEGRASRKNKNRRHKRKHPSQNSQNIHPVDTADNPLPLKYQISNDQLENGNSDATDTPVEKPPKPDPTMLELNGGEDEDAVVPVLKRPKYEPVVYETEPTEEEKELIKEYVFEDFFSSLASFYNPNDYCSVEPTKDLYWCCDLNLSPNLTDNNNTYDLLFDNPFHYVPDYHAPDNIELLAFCS